MSPAAVKHPDAIRIVCAPDSFKGSLSAADAAAAMARGLTHAGQRVGKSTAFDIDVCPVADGGEGTVDALVVAGAGRFEVSHVMGPRGETVEARWGMLGGGMLGAATGQTTPTLARKPSDRTAVIEMAAAAGLTRLRDSERDPAATTTYGVGQLIVAAVDAGAKKIILGVGGSATCDGGCGAAQALGAVFFDRHGRPIGEATPICGGMLADIARVDLRALRERLDGVAWTVACDVRNPLVGPCGAAAVYGPQKGASPRQVRLLDQGLAHIAKVWRAETGRDVTQLPGAGAAGGFGGGAVAMLGPDSLARNSRARNPLTQGMPVSDTHTSVTHAVDRQGMLRPGIELVLEAVDFSRRLAGASLVLTGEGKLDGQTLSGKAVVGVAQAAQGAGVPVVALAGRFSGDIDRLRELGVTAWRAIGEGLDEAESIRRASELVEQAASRIGSELLEGGGAWR